MFRLILRSILVIGLLGCASSKEKTKSSDGFKLVAIKKGSIYDRLGLKKGDVITKYNDKKVESPSDAIDLYDALKTNSKIQIELQRDGKPLTINSQLRSKKN